MAEQVKVAFVAAMEREIAELVQDWRIDEKDCEGRRYKFFEDDAFVLVCGGIGAQAARRATEAVITCYKPMLVQSVGFAGALDPNGKVGDIVVPNRVVDATDGVRYAMNTGRGTLVTVSAVAGLEQKATLAKSYQAQIVDMEAAAVARAAEARGVAFSAVKVISDESGFEMPDMDRFVSDGRFRSGAFVTYVLIRPWLWPMVWRLARNSAKASHALCKAIREQLASADILKIMNTNLHPIGSAN